MKDRLQLLIDGRAFSLQEKGGVSQMWASLLGSKPIRERARIDLFVYPGFRKNIHLREVLSSSDKADIQLIESANPPSDNSNHAGAERAAQRKQEIAKKARFQPDAVVNTYYGENVFPDCQRYLVCAHDFAHEELPELRTKPTTAEVVSRKRLAFDSATSISFVSNATRVKFFEYYGARSGVSTRVIYHGHDESLPRTGRVRHQILHVGTRSHYKNFPRLRDAMKQVMATDEAVHFYVFGGEPEDESVLQLRAAFPGRVIFRQQPTDEEMALAMRMSSIFVSASRYEGFGIPLLNALRCETLPVVSHIDVYRELAGRDAIYFDPESVPSIVEALHAGLKASAKPQGYWRTWDEAASDYLNFMANH